MFCISLRFSRCRPMRAGFLNGCYDVLALGGSRLVAGHLKNGASLLRYVLFVSREGHVKVSDRRVKCISCFLTARLVRSAAVCTRVVGTRQRLRG